MPPDPDQPTPSDTSRSGLTAGMSRGQGRYTLIGPLGRGGMGVVWLAEDALLKEKVALKFLPPEIPSDPVALDDMRRETAKSRKLSHPNIIRIHDFFEGEDDAFVSMEFVDGPTLAALRLQQADRVFRWEFLVPIITQLCSALDYAHNERIIHRDLKPANMMLDSKGRLKLADFGIAAVVDEAAGRVSVKNAHSGTLGYMSPQQLDGQIPRIADDIYALGATLYELLTGKPPFYSGDVGHQVRTTAAMPIQDRLEEFELSNEVPPAVAAMVMACLSKKPEQRPQSARAIAEWIGLQTEGLVASASESLLAEPDASHATETIACRFCGVANSLQAIYCNKCGHEIKRKGGSLKIILLVLALVPVAFAIFYFGILKDSQTDKKLRGVTNSIAAPPFEKPTSVPLTKNKFAWMPLFDGRTLGNWIAVSHFKGETSDWHITPDGSILGKGAVSHLFSPNLYTNFELMAEVKLNTGGNSGIYLRADLVATRANGYPQGYEAQINNSAPDPQKTGSLTGFSKVTEQLVADDTWFKQQIIAIGNRIVIKVNDKTVTDYTDTQDTYHSGRLALQQNTPKTVVEFRNLMIKQLPADINQAWVEAGIDMPNLSNQASNDSKIPNESKLKYGLCINFGLPTFAGSGEQGELPASRFAPAEVNVKSWVRAAKAAGMTFAMPLVNSAGFCLWPTADDDYDIAHSPFKGDILGDFIAACNAEGVLPGAYYFVSNPHNEGAGRAASPVSNLSFNFIKKQIAELHTKYPGLRVQIFNGSNRFSAEQWAELVQLLHDVNPQCLILDGNHEGVTQHMGGTVLRNYKWQPNAEFVPVAELFRRYEEAQTAKKSLLLTVGADLSGNIPDNQISVLLALKDLVRTSSSAAH